MTGTLAGDEPIATPVEGHDRAHLAERLVTLALAAGAAIMDVYGAVFAIDTKDDASPVTDADRRAEAVIVAGLRELTPTLPVVAEEEVAAGAVPVVGDGPFWLVDPLDGTKEFIKRNGEFTVNIALVEGGQPTLGVVYAPALDLLYAGIARGTAMMAEGGARRAISAVPPPPEGLTVLASRSHADTDALDAFLAAYPVRNRISAGSSLKFCQIAAGNGHLYPRLGPTMEWDTAAGHAVLAAAGGRVTTLDGLDLVYGKPGFRNPDFLACGPGV